MHGPTDSSTLRGVAVPFLAFADDVVLLSTSAAGLQSKLRLLQGFSDQSGLSVNLQKTEILVFGGQFGVQKDKHEFRYGEKRVAIVQSYRYLGVQFHCNGKFREGAQVLAGAGQKAAFALERRCAELGVRKLRSRVELFDVLVGPILGYGAEVWGPGYGPKSGGGMETGIVQSECTGHSCGVYCGFESRLYPRRFLANLAAFQ